MSERFAVAADRPNQKSGARYKYASAEAAEAVARRLVLTLGQDMAIWRQVEGRWPECVATVLRDPLERIWTQVYAAPGQPCFL